MPRLSRALPVALATFIVVPAFAGPLNPPAGPVGSTYKTLDQVEPRIPISAPRTINSPGSYYLTRNITQSGNSDGIVIASSNVTLDLNGFAISGGRTGVFVDHFPFLPANGVTIMNGSIMDVSGSGVYSGGLDDQPAGITVRNVKVFNATDLGINAGRGSIIENCYVNGGSTGIRAGFSSRVSGCTVEFARSRGFSIEGGSTITDCLAAGVDDGNGGGDGFVVGSGSTARSLTSRSNVGMGANFASECTITDSTFTNNNSTGVRLESYNTLSRCTISNNQNSGVLLDSVSSGLSSVVERCTITQNLPVGIVSFGQGAHTIRENTISRNVDFGVRVADNCQIVNNHISENGDANTDAGVFITGSGNIVQGNFISLNWGAGVELFNTSSSALVLGNTFRGNTMRTAGSGHTVAPVTNASAAVTGSNPFVNIAY